VQTIDRVRNPLFHKLLTRFYEKTGCPVLINTSFNVRSEPIVCTPDDAYRCLLMTDMDVLVMGRQIILRDEQPRVAQEERTRHLAQFQLD
jgi:carbamoyltransferase